MSAKKAKESEPEKGGKEEEEEEGKMSPSQSILSKMKAAELKIRKNARVETRGVKR